MAGMIDSLLGQMGSGTLGQLAGMLGSDEGATKDAVGAGMQAIMGGLAHNASKPEGAAALLGALNKDHDGSIMGDLTGFLGKGGGAPAMQDGKAILGHVFGTKRSAVAEQVSQNSGLSLASVGKMLPMLAPMVMGFLGKQKNDGNLDQAGLASMLQGERKAAEKANPGLLGGLTKMLDRDGDGDFKDDLGGLLGMVKKLFRRG